MIPFLFCQFPTNILLEWIDTTWAFLWCQTKTSFESSFYSYSLSFDVTFASPRFCLAGTHRFLFCFHCSFNESLSLTSAEPHLSTDICIIPWRRWSLFGSTNWWLDSLVISSLEAIKDWSGFSVLDFINVWNKIISFSLRRIHYEQRKLNMEHFICKWNKEICS